MNGYPQRLHYLQLYRCDLVDMLDNLLAVVQSGQWNEAFPVVWGYAHVVPDDHGDVEEFPEAFRSDDHAIAHRMLRYPDLHGKMAHVVEAITQKNSTEGKPLLANIFEHAGTHYATGLAMYDKQYVRLYADFLFSNDLQYECYQPYDMVRVIRRWGWCSETYYLLFARWLAGGEYCADDVGYLDFHDGLREQLDKPGETDTFLSALATFLVGIGYDADNGELNGWTAGRFKDLVEEHVYRPCSFVFPENVALAEALTSRFPGVLEMVSNAAVVATAEPETGNPEGHGWSWDDEDIPEI